MTLISGSNKGRNCFLITLNILLIKLLMESFSIEIVWQITTVIVKSCEQPTVFLQKLFCYDISGFFNRIGNTMLLHSNILNCREFTC